ncbi:MAG TPA: Mu transposase C-terminal domain-containing protein [Candidatus Binatia bacterium]|nr:Mu transposase C-terminal domain-containing protein [Candidatus Binatia bacterium]
MNANAARTLAALSEHIRAQAMQRFHLLQLHLEGTMSLTQVAQVHAVPLRTLQHWMRRYRAQGVAGLARKARTDRGRQRRVTPELTHFIEGLALRKPPPSVATIHRQVVALATQQGRHAPSYRSVYEIVKRLAPALVTLAHDGTKAYREAFDLLHRREADRPNAIWQADHTQLDLWLLDDKGQPVRPWLTVILDDYSRAVAGFGVNLTAPSAIQTSLVLRQALWRKTHPQWQVCGIPDSFYTDHGSDFTSQHLEQVSADLRMTLVFSEAGMPRGRGRIERFFRTVNQLFLCTLPGYAPAGGPSVTPVLTLSALEDRLLTFLVEHYNHRRHSETGHAPQACWEQGGFLPRLPDSLEELDLLLLTVAKARRVQRDGIRFQGVRYLDPTLAAYIGESVIIRYDPRDMAEIRVFHNNTFLCRAVSPELAGETLSLRDLIRARNRRRRDLRHTLQERQRTVDALLDTRRWTPSEEEAGTLLSTPEPLPAKLKRYIND